jgi:alpha-glucosidase/alpha-D-xyloside xylohydrolase
MFAGVIRGQATDIIVAGQPVEIAVWSVSAATVRITVRPVQNGNVVPVPVTGALVQEEFGNPRVRTRNPGAASRVRAGNVMVSFTEGPPAIQVHTVAGALVQQLTLDSVKPGLTFLLGDGPLLGFGEGGAQFDRRGAIDDMRSGQGARSAAPRPFLLDTHGTRAPVQWLIGTSNGWAMFIHQPYGAFDLSGNRGVFTPRPATELPLDVFIVSSRDPKLVMREYARITGLPEMPARWTFGYQQSSRTLAGPDEILGVARTFREKKLPCDALIYLGTEFAVRTGEPIGSPNCVMIACSVSFSV